LPTLKVVRPALAGVQSQVVQNVAVRLDRALIAPFTRAFAAAKPVKRRGIRAVAGVVGTTAAPSRKCRWGVGWVSGGCRVDTDERRMRIARVGQGRTGSDRVGQGRTGSDRSRYFCIVGTPKTATVSRSSTGKWDVCCSCACADPSPLPATGQRVGIDVGLKMFATLSSGAEIATPRFFPLLPPRREGACQGPAPRVQRGDLSKEEKGTPERARRRKVVARVHERTRWRRCDFAHQHSRRIVNQFDVLAGEDVSVNRMLHHHGLAKSLHDVAWSHFASLLAYKAACAGRTYVAVNPASTRQDCSQSGHRKTDLTLADRP
jgi:putative transposase